MTPIVLLSFAILILFVWVADHNRVIAGLREDLKDLRQDVDANRKHHDTIDIQLCKVLGAKDVSDR